MKLKANRNLTGIFYPKKHVLKFKKNTELISDSDIFDLFFGFINLIKKNTELKLESQYINEINKLKNELKILKNSN